MKILFTKRALFLQVFILAGYLVSMSWLAGCRLAPSQPTSSPASTVRSSEQVLSADEIATLDSLAKVDEYPLYTMRYIGAYSQAVLPGGSLPLHETASRMIPNACPVAWGCALFAALGDPDSRLYGRNFDWRFSPAVLLFTDPPDGYASVSMVDIEYLGFGGEQSKNLLDLSLDERQALLAAPALPADGMNERGLAVGMAAVPSGEMRADPSKKTINQIAVIREILDYAGTVDEAVNILANYNIDMGSVPLHYLVASSMGDSALVEFYQGEMVVFRNEDAWQIATNFLVASTEGKPQGQCPRYDYISQRLQETGGQFDVQAALSLLADVSQDHPQEGSDTQWSLVYDMTEGEIHIVMGREYAGGAHTLELK
jgi:hypothetical protein